MHTNPITSLWDLWASPVTYLESLPPAIQDEYIMRTKPEYTVLLLALSPVCQVIPL